MMENYAYFPNAGKPPAMSTTLPMRLFLLRVTMALMVSAMLLSAGAFLTYTQNGAAGQGGAYNAGLSTIITLVAAYHYRAILMARVGAAGLSKRDEELEVDGLRHSDWLVTLPLLVLKLYSVILNPDRELLLDNPELSALMAMLMVLFGAVARLALDWGLAFEDMGQMQRIFVFACYLVSVGILVVILIDIGSTQADSSSPGLIWSFFLVWIGYPIVAIGSFLMRSTNGADSEWLSFFKDIAYCVLDLWSKAVFAWWTASHAFGVRFLNA